MTCLMAGSDGIIGYQWVEHEIDTACKVLEKYGSCMTQWRLWLGVTKKNLDRARALSTICGDSVSLLLEVSQDLNDFMRAFDRDVACVEREEGEEQ